MNTQSDLDGRRLQFSLRFLLIWIGLLAAYLGIYLAWWPKTVQALCMAAPRWLAATSVGVARAFAPGWFRLLAWFFGGPLLMQALEHVLGQTLRANQQLVIWIVNLQVQPDVPAETARPGREGGAVLPEWCNVYAGLSDEEIADLEEIILTRADLSR